MLDDLLFVGLPVADVLLNGNESGWLEEFSVFTVLDSLQGVSCQLTKYAEEVEDAPRQH